MVTVTEVILYEEPSIDESQTGVKVKNRNKVCSFLAETGSKNDVILLPMRRNDVATSLWRHFDVMCSLGWHIYECIMA